ncbi:iron transporter [Mitsuaria sp. WAJ17]|uniref:iron transporter n=1 Tax=Mitsuaria sp. WAJ17 TaxID=2761452 RepID=UPI001602F953|nr:iron transporter [Mitsuaria sp. WAJ17]MBB2484053.1 iron transporter [Mitsuaria sp. WAJ17]
MTFNRCWQTLVLGLALCRGAPALAAEIPIGTPQNLAGMEIAAVYLQPVDMEPEGHMRAAADSDIHLEADIHALASNGNGFAEGTWIPYLHIRYELRKVGSSEVISGLLMPMVASDGPHYGDNVKLRGPGKYQVRFILSAPNAPDNAMGKHFGRHTDRATGVRPWFKPLTAEWEFNYAGVGKKGGY